MTTTSTTNPLVLVTGATGKTGRRIIPRLAARGVSTRAASRGGTVPFDWGRPETWAATLDGVDAAYIAYAPDVTMPGAVDTIGRFCATAVDAGVAHLVLLSGRGEPEAEAAEDIVRSSGAMWTIVRASWFAQNFSEDFFYGPVLAGQLDLPAGTVGEPFVDVEDIADVAAAALLDRSHHGRTYDVTGPRLLTFADAAAEIATATGRRLTYVQVSADDFRRGAIEEGVPAEFAEALSELFVRVFDGRNAYVGHGVEEALGRPATDFADYARRTAATGAWDVDDLDVAG